MKSLKKRNQEFARDLRRMADLYDAHADKPWLAPSSQRLLVCLGAGAFREAAREIGTCKKELDGDYAALTVEFGSIKLYLFTARENACHRVQTGTKTVPERKIEATEAKVIPAHEEPVYEWDCTPFLAGGNDGGSNGEEDSGAETE